MPAALVAALVIAALVWNAFVGLTFGLSAWKVASAPGGALLAALYFRAFRPREVRSRELALYMGLWILFPIFGTIVTQLGVAAGFPFQDRLFSQWDRAFGFDWLAWRQTLLAKPSLNWALNLAYVSSFWQPFLIVPAIVYWRPGGRNAEFLTAIMIALFLTVLGSTLLPAIGPAATYGVDPSLANFAANLRSPHPAPSWYVGVICFPSFHTVMAILFIWANRGIPTFWSFAILNSFMLASIPIRGNHYLVDLFGGAFVAAVAILAVRKPAESRLPSVQPAQVL